MAFKVVTAWADFYQNSIESRIARSDLAEMSAVTDRVLGWNGDVYAERIVRDQQRDPRGVYSGEIERATKDRVC